MTWADLSCVHSNKDELYETSLTDSVSEFWRLGYDGKTDHYSGSVRLDNKAWKKRLYSGTTEEDDYIVHSIE